MSGRFDRHGYWFRRIASSTMAASSSTPTSSNVQKTLSSPVTMTAPKIGPFSPRSSNSQVKLNSIEPHAWLPDILTRFGQSRPEQSARRTSALGFDRRAPATAARCLNCSQRFTSLRVNQAGSQRVAAHRLRQIPIICASRSCAHSVARSAMNLPCRYAAAIIARPISVMRPHGGKRLALIRRSPPARSGWKRIRCQQRQQLYHRRKDSGKTPDKDGGASPFVHAIVCVAQ